MKRYENLNNVLLLFWGWLFIIAMIVRWWAIFLNKVPTCDSTTEHQEVMATLSGISERFEWCGQCSEVMTASVVEEPEEELTRADICVWIKNISINEWQAKNFLECIWDQNWWYCYCVETYATCDLQLSDIPEEFRNDFNPDCAKD